MTLGKEAILAADDLKRETVSVPEWGDAATVTIRMMTAAERQEYFKHAIKTVGGKVEVSEHSAEAAMVAMTTCDDDGRLLFTIADIPALAAKSAVAIARVANAAAVLNAIGGTARRTLAKN